MSILYPALTFTSFPNNIQTFVTMLNMTAQDGSLVTQFQEAMQQGNTQLAQQYYNQITNANQKFIDSKKLNTLMDTCVALQNFYKTDIQPYIDTKQAEWQDIINEFTYAGVYSPTTQYEVNNFVMFATLGVNLLYLCIKRPTIGIQPNNTEYWRQLTIQGTRGLSGAGLAFLYEWDAVKSYILQDAVTYNNALWGCIQPNTNQPPYEGSAYWQLIGSVGQVVYPFQSYPPIGQVEGELWLKIL